MIRTLARSRAASLSALNPTTSRAASTSTATTKTTSQSISTSTTAADNSIPQETSQSNANPEKTKEDPTEKPIAKKKTMAELDEELKLKMRGLAGDGGDAGIEYEDGQPVAMKRSVKENMFRLI